MVRSPSHDGVELPTLEPGVTLLDIDDDLGVEPLCALVIDRLLDRGDRAFWVDAGGHVRTKTLATLAPHPRYLDRITVARGFTPYQHAALLDRLPRVVSDAVVERIEPAVIVVPAMDRLYRTDEIARSAAEDLLVRRLAALAGIARERDVPVLLTRDRDDDLTAPLAAAAHTRLRCRTTQFGPRFTTESETAEADATTGETLVYHMGDGWLQTTLTFWQEILEHRARTVGAAVAESPSATGPAETPSPTTPEGW